MILERERTSVKGGERMQESAVDHRARRKPETQALVDRFLEAIGDLSQLEAEELTGLNDSTISRLRRDAWTFLHPSTKRAMQRFLDLWQNAPPDLINAIRNPHPLREYPEVDYASLGLEDRMLAVHPKILPLLDGMLRRVVENAQSEQLRAVASGLIATLEALDAIRGSEASDDDRYYEQLEALQGLYSIYVWPLMREELLMPDSAQDRR